MHEYERTDLDVCRQCEFVELIPYAKLHICCHREFVRNPESTSTMMKAQIPTPMGFPSSTTVLVKALACLLFISSTTGESLVPNIHSMSGNLLQRGSRLSLDAAHHLPIELASLRTLKRSHPVTILIARTHTTTECHLVKRELHAPSPCMKSSMPLLSTQHQLCSQTTYMLRTLSSAIDPHSIRGFPSLV